MGRDKDEMTPAHWAADFGYAECLEKLVLKGCDVLATDLDGRSPLHYAAKGGRLTCIRELLKPRPSPDEGNSTRSPGRGEQADTSMLEVCVSARLGIVCAPV
jgi:ankyrin repeat protein